MKWFDDKIKKILCSRYESHDFKPYQVYRDPGGYTAAWKKCSRCGKILDEHLDAIAERYIEIQKDYFQLKGF